MTESSAAALAQFARLSDAATVASTLHGRVIDGVEIRVTYQPRQSVPQFAPQPVPTHYAPASYAPPAPSRQYTPTPGPSYNSPAKHSGRVSSGGSTVEDASLAIDWNDARNLAIRDRLVQFRDDGLRDELPFTRALDSERRRIVRLIAHRLGLPHRTVGDEGNRQVVVYKPQAG